MADLHSKILEARPLRVQNSFNFMQFLTPHLGEILDPPLNSVHFVKKKLHKHVLNSKLKSVTPKLKLKLKENHSGVADVGRN